MTERTQVTPLTVGQVAERFAITVRTLHHYDEVGLLSPSERTRAGYRLYTDGDLTRLQHIVVYRRLGFALEEIALLLEKPESVEQHLRRQRAAVTSRLDEMRDLVTAIDRALEREMNNQPATPDDLKELFGDGFHDAQAEAEERWGETDAWRQSQERTKGYTKADWEEVKAESDRTHQAFTDAMDAGEPPTSEVAMDAAELHRGLDAAVLRMFLRHAPQPRRHVRQRPAVHRDLRRDPARHGALRARRHPRQRGPPPALSPRTGMPGAHRAHPAYLFLRAAPLVGQGMDLIWSHHGIGHIVGKRPEPVSRSAAEAGTRGLEKQVKKFRRDLFWRLYTGYDLANSPQNPLREHVMTMRNFLSAHAAQGGVRAGAVAATALALGLTGCSAVGSSSGAQSGSSAGGASAGASGAAGEDVYGEPASAGEVKKGGSLVMALSAEPDKLDPTLSRSLYSRYVFHAMCQKLYDVDQKRQIVPQLATGAARRSAATA